MRGTARNGRARENPASGPMGCSTARICGGSFGKELHAFTLLECCKFAHFCARFDGGKNVRLGCSTAIETAIPSRGVLASFDVQARFFVEEGHVLFRGWVPGLVNRLW